MSAIFETSLNVRPASVDKQFRPSFSDPSFFSDVINSRPDSYLIPLISYQWESSNGDEIVDEFDNQIVFMQPAS